MNDRWGAFCNRDIALGPLHSGILDGLTFAVKDVYDIQGYTPGAGNPDWKRTHPPADQHAEAILLLLRQGARLTGTTHTDELMFGLNGENDHYGTPVNPKAPQRIPGGSSSGSAVAVAAGLADFALGTDTAGSVRIPAGYCGIYGFRPTYGLVSMNGVIPLAPRFDTVGWMAREADVLLRVGVSLAEKAISDEDEFRCALIGKDAMELVDPECRTVVRKVIQQIGSELPIANELTIAEEGLSEWLRIFRTLQGLDIWRTHGAWIQREQPRFGPGVAERFAWTGTLDEHSSMSELRMSREIRGRLSDVLGDDTLLLLPTAPGPAPVCGTQGPELENRRVRTLQLTCIAALGGLPQVTLPWGEWDGIPVGISVIAGPHQDLKLLRWVKNLKCRTGGSKGDQTWKRTKLLDGFRNECRSSENENEGTAC